MATGYLLTEAGTSVGGGADTDALADLAGGIGTAISATVAGGSLAARPDIANAPAATDLVLWLSIDAIDELTDAQFVDLRDNWGVTTIACGMNYMYTMGGSQKRTSDTSATFTSADGRAGSEWTHCRKIKYGNNGTGTGGLGNIVTRLHALGMKIYAGTRLRSLPNRTTVLAEWFDDAAWVTLVSPTGPLAEHVSYAEAWGFDGVTFDDEILNDGNTPEPTWKWNYSGNTRNESTTRIKVRDRGAAVGALFASIWPDMDIIEYNTTGHGGFPDDWDEDFSQEAAGRIDVKEPLVQRDFWDGVFTTTAFTGTLRFLSSTFYRAVGSGATFYGAEQYNAVSVLARLSRTWTSWNRSHNRFFINPFHWPGHAAAAGGGEDFPMSLATIQNSFAASRILGMNHIGFYTQTITSDNAYFTAAMEDVFQAARVPGTVNTVVPSLSAITQSGRVGNNVTLSGTAAHPLGIAYIEWEVFNAAGSAVESIGAFGHSFVPGTGDHQDATGFADATYPFIGTISAPVGRTVRITAVSIKGQSHSTQIGGSGSSSGTGFAGTAAGSGAAYNALVTTPPPAYPTSATTGVPTGTGLNGVGVNALTWRTSIEGASISTTEVIGPNTYRVFTAKNFVGTTGYISLNEPYVKFQSCKFAWSGQVNNTSSMVQGSSSLIDVICNDCTFDGGAAWHNRGIQCDTGDITILRGNFTRCGNAAIEKNDPTGLWSLTVTDSYITEVKGWPVADHADGIQMGAGNNFTVTHNTIWIEPYRAADGNQSDVSNSCIGLWAEGGDVTGDVLINNNQMSGGGSIMYCEEKSGFTFQGTVTVDTNRFVRNHFASLQGAAYNPTSGHAAVWYVLAPPGRPVALTGAGSGWTNNTWEDGTTVTLAVAITST